MRGGGNLGISQDRDTDLVYTVEIQVIGFLLLLIKYREMYTSNVGVLHLPHPIGGGGIDGERGGAQAFAGGSCQSAVHTTVKHCIFSH